MIIAILKETYPGERRAAMIPADVAKLVKRGSKVSIESGMGAASGHADADFIKAGAEVHSNRAELMSTADMVIRLRKPSVDDITKLKKSAIHISFLDPFNDREVTKSMAAQGISAIGMEMMPRSTRAQKMDAISSQASLAGYVAVILAAERSSKILPMMTTPAGTIQPSRVFIIGAGVAGLQAIATAKRLGARVDAFDTRPEVAEQIKSLGGKFFEIDLGETGKTADGYAKELTPEQIAKQRQAMAKQCALSDVVISTAQVFGKKAPIIITKEMVAGMRPGSVVVDLAIESGGNVDGAELGKELNLNGVLVIGLENLPGHVAVHASQMYSANVTAFVEEFWDKEKSAFNLNLEDEIIQRSLVTHGGQIVNDMIKKIYA